MLRIGLLVLTVVHACPAQAEFRFEDATDEQVAFVESNLLGIFYHELGHALIDLLDLPIFGQEEDAADVLSVFLIDAFYEEDAAVSMAYDTAFGFLGEAENAGDIAFWDVHGPDLQRYYNLVCLFYGANPDDRSDVADDLGLPQDRAEWCPDEYDQAAHSWGGALDQITQVGGGQSFLIGEVEVDSDGGELAAEVIRFELEALNDEFRLPEPLLVSIVPCGEANAFYDAEYAEITMCAEFVDTLDDMSVDF